MNYPSKGVSFEEHLGSDLPSGEPSAMFGGGNGGEPSHFSAKKSQVDTPSTDENGVTTHRVADYSKGNEPWGESGGLSSSSDYNAEYQTTRGNTQFRTPMDKARYTSDTRTLGADKQAGSSSPVDTGYGRELGKNSVTEDQGIAQHRMSENENMAKQWSGR